MKNNQNIITRKIKYSVSSPVEKELILKYIKNYNNVLRFTVNRLQENPSLKVSQLSHMQKSMNNIFVDTHFLGSAICNAKMIVNKVGNTKVVFGGKKLMTSRCKGKISHEEWVDNCL